VKLLATLNIDKSVMGDVYNWRCQLLEAVRSKGHWDALFSCWLYVECKVFWERIEQGQDCHVRLESHSRKICERKFWKAFA